MKVPDDEFRCYRCDAEAEVTYPDGRGSQTRVCGPCELLLIRDNRGNAPIWIAR